MLLFSLCSCSWTAKLRAPGSCWKTNGVFLAHYLMYYLASLIMSWLILGASWNTNLLAVLTQIIWRYFYDFISPCTKWKKKRKIGHVNQNSKQPVWYAGITCISPNRIWSDCTVLKRAGWGLLCTSSNRPTVLCCHWKPRQASSAMAMMSAAMLKIAMLSSLAD